MKATTHNYLWFTNILTPLLSRRKKLQTCLKTKTVVILLSPHMFQNNFSRWLDLCELLWYKQKHKDAYQKVIQFYEHQL
jgi:hypothetical protein